MGIVYAAEDPRLGRSVALKTVRSELAGPEARERLRREARAAASISHPNICQLYEIGEHEGELFIAMELLEGESLAERITKGALPVRMPRGSGSTCSLPWRRSIAGACCIAI